MISFWLRTCISAAVIALAGHSSSPSAIAQHSDSTLQRIVRERVQSGRSAGIVLGIIDSTGIARVVSWRSGSAPGSLDGNSVFEIGSITKVFTGTLLAEMSRRGEVRLDDAADVYLPMDVALPQRNGRRIRLVDLAAHASALPNSRGDHVPTDPTNPYADYTVRHMYDFLPTVQLERDIGSAYEYSNLGAALLGHLLENRADLAYGDLLRERILGPLQMHDTAIELTNDMAERLVPGHDASLNPVRNWVFDAFAPAGALRSTVNDMLKFLAANLRPPASQLGVAIADSHEVRFTINPYASVALNWHYLTIEGDTVIWHPGATGGYRSFIGFNPRTKAGLVILSNSQTGIEDIGFHLLMENSPLEDVPAHIAGRKEVELNALALRQFVGRYQFDPKTLLDVVLENGKLFGIHKFGKVQLHPESESSFFLFESDTQIRFERDRHGEVIGLIEREGGKESRALKVR